MTSNMLIAVVHRCATALVPCVEWTIYIVLCVMPVCVCVKNAALCCGVYVFGIWQIEISLI